MKKVINLFYAVFFVLLLMIAALFLATLFPLRGGVQVKIVESGSMEPAIHTGSIIIIRPQSQYAVGDVVTFGADTKVQVPTTHRIVAFQTNDSGQSVIVTKGDANEEADPEFTPTSMIIGKVLMTVPYAGYIIDLARKPHGFVLLIGIPAIVIVIDEAANIVSEVRRMRGQKGIAHSVHRDDSLQTSPGPTLVNLRKDSSSS